MEFTFYRKDRGVFEYRSLSYPHPLDARNVAEMPDIPLPKCWYYTIRDGHAFTRRIMLRVHENMLQRGCSTSPAACERASLEKHIGAKPAEPRLSTRGLEVVATGLLSS